MATTTETTGTVEVASPRLKNVFWAVKMGAVCILPWTIRHQKQESIAAIVADQRRPWDELLADGFCVIRIDARELIG